MVLKSGDKRASATSIRRCTALPAPDADIGLPERAVFNFPEEGRGMHRHLRKLSSLRVLTQSEPKAAFLRKLIISNNVFEFQLAVFHGIVCGGFG